jgi:hypothetical protein
MCENWSPDGMGPEITKTDAQKAVVVQDQPNYLPMHCMAIVEYQSICTKF